MPNWKSAESYQRLLAAMVASQDLKLNFRQIAKYYGEGTTYNSIEGRFRIIKEQAKLLKAEIDSGEPTAATSNDQNPAPTSSFASNASESTPTKPRTKKNATSNGTPTPKKEKVLTGRVGKNGSTPAAKATPINRDGVEAFGMFGMDGTAEIGDGNVSMGVKEEGVSSGGSSYHGGENAVNDVVAMSMGLAWDAGFLGQQLI